MYLRTRDTRIPPNYDDFNGEMMIYHRIFGVPHFQRNQFVILDAFGWGETGT